MVSLVERLDDHSEMNRAEDPISKREYGPTTGVEENGLPERRDLDRD